VTKILVIHGISNQYRGAMELHGAWFPALCDGLLLAGHNREQLPRAEDCFCPFYGDVFRPTGTLSTQAELDPSAVETASSEDAKLLQTVWEAAAKTDSAVPGPEQFNDTLVWAPHVVERALASLAKSKYLADYVPIQFFGDLKQVVLYLNDAAKRQSILDRVLPCITSDTRIVIGHSLGSIIAYEAVSAKPKEVTDLITIGSPLGLRNIIFDKLTPRADAAGHGIWPGRVRNWTNIAAKGDIVAAVKVLAPLFGSRVHDVLIDSGLDAHNSERYLNTIQAGQAIARGLA
jgi:hypothetical protein